MIHIAIVEDKDNLREALASYIKGEPDMLCLYSFPDAEQALEVLSADPVDVVLMDIHLPGMSGIECVRKLRERHSAMQFLMCTIFEDDDNIFRSLEAGASGYILKGSGSEAILAAIRDLQTGGSPMNAQVARRVIQSFHKQSASTVTEEASMLTKREMELLELLSKAYRYKEIADRLFISIETVRKHINNIYNKLHVQSRMEAVNKVFGRS
jgi:DNA-binding NarL/FixJ family response regulator